MALRILVLLVLPLILSACASAKATFQVAVKNQTGKPLSIGLVKVGGELEPGWDGPEHVAIHAPQHANRKWGTPVAPGAAETLGPQTGTFYQGSRAVLRVYAADVTIDELLGYSRRDSHRLDIMVNPGNSAYVIETDAKGALTYRPVSVAP